METVRAVSASSAAKCFFFVAPTGTFLYIVPFVCLSKRSLRQDILEDFYIEFVETHLFIYGKTIVWPLHKLFKCIWHSGCVTAYTAPINALDSF